MNTLVIQPTENTEVAMVARVNELHRMDTLARLEMGYLLKELKGSAKTWKVFVENNLPIGVRQADTYIKAFNEAIEQKLVELETPTVEATATLAEPAVEVVTVVTAEPLPSMTELAKPKRDYVEELMAKQERADKAMATKRANRLAKQEEGRELQVKFDAFITDNGLKDSWAAGEDYLAENMNNVMGLEMHQIDYADRKFNEAKEVIKEALAKLTVLAEDIEDEVGTDLLYDAVSALEEL